MNDFPLIAKWVSRKLATLALLFVFISNTPKAPPGVKVIAAAIVTGVYIVCQSWVDRYRPEAEPVSPSDDTQEFSAVG